MPRNKKKKGGSRPTPTPTLTPRTLVKVPSQSLGADIRLGIVDTGIHATHPEFLGRLVAARDFTGRAVISDVRDFSGHGTAMAGIAAGTGIMTGTRGVADACEIVVARAFDSSGSTNVTRVASAIDYCVTEGCDVILLALRVGSPDPQIDAALARAEAADVVVVASSGNFANLVEYPANNPTVVAVASCNLASVPSSFSSVGPENDLCAPGENVMTAAINGGYAPITGTSPASAFVAGAAVAILGQDPALSNADVRARLRHTAVDIHVPGVDDETGYGLLDVTAAIAPQ